MEKIKEIFIVPYCHPDWAWTFTRKWHEKRYVLVFEEVLDILKKHPDYRWYMDTYITQLEPLLRYKPQKYAELKKRIEEGKINICGSFTNLRPSMTGEETQIRDIVFGKEKYRRLFPEADLSVYAGNVDVSVGHPQVPQILVLSGYKYLRFWRPQHALSRKKIPLEFYWKGLDGSKILCSRGCYGGVCYSENLFENFKREVAKDQELSPTGMRWINMGADDCRPLRTHYKDEPIPMFDFIKEFEGKESILVKFATPLEAFKKLEECKNKIPVVSGSLDPCEVCYNVGWGGSKGLFYLRQQNEINLTIAEEWISIAILQSVIATRRGEEAIVFEEKVNKLWERHLLSCAHATQWLFQEDFEEIYNLALSVKLESERAKKDALRCLVKNISIPQNTETVIFNSLPFEREEKISLAVSFPESAEEFCLIDGKNKPIPFQIKEKNENSKKFWEYWIVAKVDIPPCGYNTISIIKGKNEPKLEKIPFSVHFDGPHLTEVEAGNKKYNTSRENSFGNLKLYRVDTTKGALHAGPITEIKEVNWSKSKIKEDGEIYTRHYSEGNIENHSIKREVIVYRDEPRMEFYVEVNWMKEDGFLTLEWPRLFPGKIYGDIPFGVEEKNIDSESFLKPGEKPGENIERQRQGLFFAKSFVNCTDGEQSISYLNYDATHYYVLSDNSIGNILHNSVTNLTGWERFVNEEMKGEGWHRFVSHIIFHTGDWKSAHLPQKSQTLLRKPDLIPVDKISRGELPPVYSFLSISPSNLIMTGFYKEKNYFILRFYETEGKRTKARIELPFTAKKVEKVNLLGEKIVLIGHGKNVGISVKPWEIVTLKIK